VNLFGVTGVVLVLVVVLVLLLVAMTATVLVARARRLDRLHVRTDAAAAGLAAALDRRAAVVRAVAATAGPVALGEDDRRRVRTAARAVTAAGGGDLDGEREEAENGLTHALASLDTSALPADLAAELADAHARVSVARRVHNDAVRDTRALRGRRMVRWLHLAGTAPVPRYFEIAEPGPAVADAPKAAQDAVRVVVVDGEDRVLLFEGVDPARPAEAFWFTPGGGVRPGEDPREAVVRTLAEETGLRVDPDEVSKPLWVREVVFEVGDVSYAGCEVFHLVRAGGAERIDTAGFTEHEARTVRGHRWWTAAELAVTLDVVHPHQLADLLADPATLEPASGPLAIH
jgi:ADP-ribose pyrophosphatase YjhB (NUDIX family)